MSDLADKLALASRYNVLSGCVTLEVSLFKTGIDELRRLESENARLRKENEVSYNNAVRLGQLLVAEGDMVTRLRKAIEAAPHGKWCRARGICECWKSKTLGETE